MVLGRQAVLAMKGHSQEVVRGAAHTAAPDLVAMLQPYATKVFEEHRANGVKVVLATTTPRDLLILQARMHIATACLTNLS